MATNYTTKTASLKATTADVRKVDTKKLNINGNPFSKVVSDNVPETPTANDIWKYAVTTDDEGVVTVTDDVTVDYSELTSAQKNITKTAAKVINNKVLKANNSLLMNWDTKNFTNESNSSMGSIFGGEFLQRANFIEWNSDLSSLEDGEYMFYYTSLESFSGDLSNLKEGYHMFSYCSALQSFSGDLSKLTDGSSMFAYCAALQSFSGDLSKLTDGSSMFSNTSLTSFNGDLSKLTDGYYMFFYTALESFSGDLSSLTNGNRMFYRTALESFNSNLSSLEDGRYMFRYNSLKSFNSDLSSLTNGTYMFHGTALESFSGDLSSLENGEYMFYDTSLQSFNGDLSNLTNGSYMFKHNQSRHHGLMYYTTVNGTKKLVRETIVSTGLKSFISNLSSLENGYHMFGSGDDVSYTYTENGKKVTEITKDAAPLDEESIMLIADTIKNIKGLGLTGNNGQLWLGYDSSITDTTNIFKYCNEIVDKGWTVYLNGSDNGPDYVFTDSDSVALIDGESTSTPIPHYYKPVQVTDEEIAEYVDANNNYYIIVGGQHVFGDDTSTYGMFTSYQHAVAEITTALGLTPYEKPAEEPEI